MKDMNLFDTPIDLNKGKSFMLYNKDIPLIMFYSKKDIFGRYFTGYVYKENKKHFPYMLKDNINLLTDWIEARPIQTNHEHIKRVLETYGIKQANPLDLLMINFGFSLNDTFWIKPLDSQISGDEVCWKANNLYDKPFEEALGLITYFGNKSSLGGTLRSPDITTAGSVGKAWRIIDGKKLLFKKSSEDCANGGKEHYAEEIASRIAEILDIPHVKYWRSKWHDKHCSVCEIFTTEQSGYLPMYQYMNTLTTNTREWNLGYMIEHLDEYTMCYIEDMLVFDFIIENEDRHFGNFGYLIDNFKQDVIEMAPLFDHGYSLMSRDMEIDFKTRNYFKYSKNGTFNMSNMEQASYVLEHNIDKYTSWAKKLVNNLDYLKLNHCPDWYNDAVRKLIFSRCEIIKES